MRIAVLGWGSLIWKNLDLQIENNHWYNDGILLPVEYARISNDRRLTLVIRPTSTPVKTLYAVSTLTSLPEAKENLRIREGRPHRRYIGHFVFANADSSIQSFQDEISGKLIEWNQGKNFDAVIWTDIQANFIESSGAELNIDNIKDHFRNLTQPEFVEAAQYVLNTPHQVQTDFRPAIEDFLRNEMNFDLDPDAA